MKRPKQDLQNTIRTLKKEKHDLAKEVKTLKKAASKKLVDENYKLKERVKKLESVINGAKKLYETI